MVKSVDLNTSDPVNTRISYKICCLIYICRLNKFGIWKKIPEPEDERCETSESGDMAKKLMVFHGCSARPPYKKCPSNIRNICPSNLKYAHPTYEKCPSDLRKVGPSDLRKSAHPTYDPTNKNPWRTQDYLVYFTRVTRHYPVIIHVLSRWLSTILSRV